MSHLMRILPALLIMSCCVSQTMQGEYSAMPEKHSDYRARCNMLARHLETLRSPAPIEQDARTSVLSEGGDSVNYRKTALLTSSLQALIAAQGTDLPKGGPLGLGHIPPRYSKVEDPSIYLETSSVLEENNDKNFVGALEESQTEELPASEPFNRAKLSERRENSDADDEPLDSGEELQEAASEEGMEEEEEPVPPPLPPGPRVQTSDEVKESNASLVSQLRGLMRMVSSDNANDASDATKPDAAEPASPMLNVASTEQGVGETTIPGEQQMETPGGSPTPELLIKPAMSGMPKSIPYVGNPLDQLVDIDCRDMDLTHVVAVLALKADINIIAGADLRGTVTANLRQVPLRVAMETALRMNGLGMIEENGIYFIIPYDEAAAVNRKTTMVTLKNAEAGELKNILEEAIAGIRDEAAVNISANKTSNVLLISAPENRVDELTAMAYQLDVAEPVLPTITEAISLNYTEPKQLVQLVQKMVTDKIGQVAADDRARHLIVTDMPVVVEQIKELIKKIDIPTKQVLIESMVVDAVLSDEADTGVQWLMESIRRMSRKEAALGEDGRAVGNLQELSLISDMEAMQNPGSALNFGVLANNINWQGLIQMEVRNRNGRLVSNPVLLTVENEPATIAIAQEIPYTELKSSEVGGQQTTTEFKDVGTVLTVTPRVTHDDTIICTVEGKESTTSGDYQGIPIEDKREIKSTMRMGSGQTIYIGGLRKSNATSSMKKMPVLGDVPIVNFMFRNNQRKEQINELLVFLTCTVVQDNVSKLTPYQQEVVETAPPIVPRVDAWETVMYDTAHPKDSKEVQMKWRRGS